MSKEATLSNDGNFTIFSYDGTDIKFKTSSKLLRYTRINKWDKGYIEVIANYKNLGEIEEYIDLRPIVRMLYMDSDKFLNDIQKVRLKYD